MITNRTTGQRGEDRAADFLIRQGWRIVERNFRCRWGEADIVVSNGKEIMLVEVKARTGGQFGTPAEAIGRLKLRRMVRVAQCWMTEHRLTMPTRLGVVTILGENEPELISDIEVID